MLVEIDLDLLIRAAATMQMDDRNRLYTDKNFLVWALQQQLPSDFNLTQRLRQQVKEYKKLTMWRD